jgi:hypothetical protein
MRYRARWDNPDAIVGQVGGSYQNMQRPMLLPVTIFSTL